MSKSDTKDRIIQETHKLLELYFTRNKELIGTGDFMFDDVLPALGAYGDTLPDHEVLGILTSTRSSITRERKKQGTTRC